MIFGSVFTGELRRIIAGLEPRIALIENVAAWRRWVPKVRADLSRLGYASLPMVLPAYQFGAPHWRDRVFVVAHADSESELLCSFHEEVARLPTIARGRGFWGEPFDGIFRVDDGLPAGMAGPRNAALRAIGNAVVPQVAQWIGERIVAAHSAGRAS